MLKIPYCFWKNL